MLRLLAPVLVLLCCSSAVSMNDYQCIISGEIEKLDPLISSAETMLAILPTPVAEGQLRADFGKLFNNPTLAGVDLSRPINFHYYAGEGGSGVVWQLGVTNAELFHWSQFAYISRTKQKPGTLKTQNGAVVWSTNADVLRKFLASPPSLPDARGILKVRIRLSRAFQAFPQRFEEQFDAMRARMEQALSGHDNAQADIAAAQNNLDSAIAAFRQLDECDLTLELEGGVRISASARPLPRSPLALFLEAHPRGNLAAAALCPADVDVLVMTNLTVSGAVRSMISDALGLGFVRALNGEPATGSGRLDALTLKGDGRIELLDIRLGAGASAVRAQWDKLSQDLSPNRPIFLRPVPEPADLPNARMAQLVPNDASLGETASAVFRHLFGPVVLAAQLSIDDRVATVVSDEPVKRLKEITAIARQQKEGIAAVAAFTTVISQLPDAPNLLVYVSPRAVERWLALGGLAIPAATSGFGAAVRLETEAVQAVIAIPAPRTADASGGN